MVMTISAVSLVMFGFGFGILSGATAETVSARVWCSSICKEGLCVSDPNTALLSFMRLQVPLHSLHSMVIRTRLCIPQYMVAVAPLIRGCHYVC
jgi:hypothetical protein